MVDTAFLRSAAGDCHPAYAEAMKEAADEIERLRAALRAVQDWMDGADIIAGHPGPRVLLAGYPKDDVDAALLTDRVE